MLPPFDEQLIERYVRGPDRLDAHERLAVEDLLRQSAAAREVAALLDAFYEAFDASEEETAPQVVAFLDTLFPPARILQLRPYQAERGAVKGRTVLAAMTPSPHRRFETVATLASTEDEVLVRVVCDRDRRRCRLYTMAREPEHRAHALIAFPELALRFVTDAHGRVDFTPTAEQMVADWASAGATLASPLADGSFTIDQVELDGCMVSLGSGHTVRCAFEGGVFLLAVHAAPEAAAWPSSALVQAGERRLLLALEEGKGSIPMNVLPEHLQVWLYP